MSREARLGSACTCGKILRWRNFGGGGSQRADAGTALLLFCQRRRKARKERRVLIQTIKKMGNRRIAQKEQNSRTLTEGGRASSLRLARVVVSRSRQTESGRLDSC